MSRNTLLSVMLSTFALSALSTPARADDKELRDLFRQAVSSFEQREIEDSVKKLQELFAQDPSSDLAYEFSEEGGYRLFLGMISEGGDVATMAKKLLRLAEIRRKKDRPSVSRIRDLLEEMRKNDWVESRIAMEKLVSEVGPYVVPHVVAVLADERDDEYRATVLQMLIKMGEMAVLPLAELLKSSNSYLQQQVVIALGHIRDLRAVPYLLYLHEDPGTDRHVKDEAVESLERITGRQPGGLGSAKDWLLFDAHRYYNEHPAVAFNYYKDYLVWTWDDEGEGKLDYREVPAFQWNEQMAEELSYLALQNDPSYNPGWDMLVNAYVAQAVEAEAIYEVVEAKLNANEREGIIDGVEINLVELIDALDKGQQARERVRMLCLSRGNEVLFRALYRAMADKKIDVAVDIVATLEELEVKIEDLPAEGVSLANFLENARPRTMPTPDLSSPDNNERRGGSNQPSNQPAPSNEPAAEPETEPATDPDADPDQPGGRPRRTRSSGIFDPYRDLMAALEGNSADVLSSPDVSSLEVPQGFAPGTSLPAALDYEDKRVRFQAAITLANLGLKDRYANADAVITELADAVGQLGQRVVLVVENDLGIRNRLVALVKSLGHLAFSVEKGNYALHRARMFPAEDLIIFSTDLNADGSADDMTAEEFVNEMRKDYRTDKIPVMLLTSSSDRRTYEANMGDKVAGVIPHDIREVALKDKLDLVFDTPSFRGDSKSKAIELAASAAEALAGLDPRDGVYPTDNAELHSALTQCIELQPDAVRIPALHAIGRLRVHDAFDNALAIFNNLDNEAEVRIAAAYAVGELLRDKDLSDQTFISLKAGMAEEDINLSMAAAEALGKAHIDPERALQIFLEQRVD